MLTACTHTMPIWMDARGKGLKHATQSRGHMFRKQAANRWSKKKYSEVKKEKKKKHYQKYSQQQSKQ